MTRGRRCSLLEMRQSFWTGGLCVSLLPHPRADRGFDLFRLLSIRLPVDATDNYVEP